MKAVHGIMTLSAAIAAILGAAAPDAHAAGEAQVAQTLEEVVVTATKRDESVIKVPIMVSVLTANDLEATGVKRSADFLNSTPNITFQEDNTGETFINIRGQTSSRNSDPNVAIVVDGVTLTSNRDFNQDLFDLEQVEVLKGPQSALYGRNAAAGAIVVKTKAPSDHLEGSASVGRGNFDTNYFSGSISGPITDTLRFRGAVSLRDTGGPFTNVTSGEKSMRTTPSLARIRLLYQPSEQFSADLTVGMESTHGGTLAYNAQIVGVPSGNFDGTAIDANSADMPFITNVIGVYDEKYYHASLKLDWDLGFARLTSISGANYLDNFFGGDLTPYFPDTGQPGAQIASYAFRDKNYSQELRLTSKSDQALRWQFGFYGLHFLRDQYEVLNQDTLGVVPSPRLTILGPGTPQPTTSFGHQYYTTTSFAPFGNVEYDLTKDLRLVVAGRYDTEIRSVSEVVPGTINPVTGQSYNLCVQLTGKTADQCHSSTSFHQFEPKVSLAYDLSSDATVYASYGKGFKSGGFNPIGSRQALLAVAAAAGEPASSVFVQDQFDKEVSTTYEIGAKLRLFDRRLAINAAVFRTNITGAEQFQFIPSVGLQTTLNIDKIKSKGFDVDATALLPSGTQVFLGYGYTDAKVDAFAAAPSFVGNTAPGSFKYTLNLAATQNFQVSDNLRLTPRVEWARQGPIWWDVNNTPGTKRDALDLVKARLTLAARDNKWQVSAYGDNLLNKKYFQEVVPILSFFTVDFRGWTRTFGIEGTVKF